MTVGNRGRLAALVVVAGVIGVFFAGGAGAQTYEPGHGALQVWDAEGQANTPRWVQIWILIMLASFALGLIFVWWRVEARWAVGGIITSIAVGRILGSQTDIVILSGLVALLHLIFWSPALYMLLTRRPFLKERSAYALWSGWITLVILFSFVFDIRDAAIYLDHIAGLGLLT